ncbi:MAG: potassium-transporting ATPase subunit KdpA, partial [candidate division Zixibacteria bacterium]|nr:potassium-transporting ATPase subunit KdpA [candidate division Zixibacteria bacterium]
MSTRDILQILAYVIALIVLAPILGQFMARVFTGQPHVLSRPLGWLERNAYRLCGISADHEMSWKQYAASLLWFNGLGFLIVFILQITQHGLPLNPQHLPNVPWALSFNTAVSFMTNTNWQSYAGETTLSYLTQMVGLT